MISNYNNLIKMKKYQVLLFFSVFSVVFVGLNYLGQAIGMLPKRTFAGVLTETVIVGVVTTCFFALWARARQKRRAAGA